MWADIAIFGGIVGAIVAVVAIFVLYSIKRSINTILDRDLVLFDQNFEIKKRTLDATFAILDDVVDRGNKVKLNPDFVKRVKTCYNDLLCVMGEVALAEEFYTIASDPDFELTAVKVAEFKLKCRKDIGLSNKGSQVIAKLTAPQEAQMGETETLLRAKSANNSNQHVDTFVTTQPTTQNSRTVETTATAKPTSNTPTQGTMNNSNPRPVVSVNHNQPASQSTNTTTEKQTTTAGGTTATVTTETRTETANHATGSTSRPTATRTTLTRTQTSATTPRETIRSTTTTRKTTNPDTDSEKK